MPTKWVQVPEGHLKADLHCHSIYSGPTGHMTFFEPLDSYSTPQQIYDMARKRGMDLVTITDHDSIDGCLEFLNRNPDAADFFTGEELTVQVPEFRTSVHIAVYDITEAQHRELSTLKKDLDETLGYLRSNDILHALNHMFHCFPKGDSGLKLLHKMLCSFGVLEGLNGAMDAGHNEITWRLAEKFPGKSLIAGSDSHTLLRVGTCYTACRATNREDFLARLRTGPTLLGGSYGRFRHMFYDAMGVYLNYFFDLVYLRRVHVHWPFWKNLRNAFGWIACLPLFFAGSLTHVSALHRRDGAAVEGHRRLIEYLSSLHPLDEHHPIFGNPELA